MTTIENSSKQQRTSERLDLLGDCLTLIVHEVDMSLEGAHSLGTDLNGKKGEVAAGLGRRRLDLHHSCHCI